MGPQGIFKPAVMAAPLSITTVPEVPGKPRPYEDELGPGGLLSYRYRGTDPNHRDNVGLRQAMELQLPLIYFSGVVPGQYMASWPAFVMADSPADLSFIIGIDAAESLGGGLGEEPGSFAGDELRRAYVTRLTRQRLHQVKFRQRVLVAYKQSCSLCQLRHPELLDAAHIAADTDPKGEPVVRNGIAMCKLHHAAFDRHIIGVRPDLVVQLRHDILDEVDGPMLRHGLQELHGTPLRVVPGRSEDRPDTELLSERYERFLEAV